MRRPSSPANRYLAARLRTVGRPIFWGPAIAILLLLLFTWDFWTNPSTWASLGIGNSRTEEEPLPPEDKSIGADIDTLPVLFNDIKSSPKPSASPDAKPSPFEKKKVTGGEAITTISTNGPGFGQTPQQATNPQGVYGVFGNALAERYGLSSAGNVMGESATGFGVKSTAPAMPAQSALQSAMSKYTAPTAAQANPTTTSVNGLANSSSAADRPSEGSAPVSNPAASPSASQNSYTQLMGGSQPLQNYSTVRSAPMVPAASSELPSVSPAPLPAGFGQTAVPQPSTSPETTLNQQPFSVPRSIPGRSIGGGNINTFSNP
jgi:hypothetical protein